MKSKLAQRTIETMCQQAGVNSKDIEGEILFCYHPKKYYLIIHWYALSTLREIQLDENVLPIGAELIKQLAPENRKMYF